MTTQTAQFGHLYVRLNSQNIKNVLRYAEKFEKSLRIIVGADIVEHRPREVSDLAHLGCEVTVDLKAAETAAPASLSSIEGKVPWAQPEGLLTPDAFRDRMSHTIEEMVDTLTIGQGQVVDAALAPCHLVTKGKPEWLAADIEAFGRLYRGLQERQAPRIVLNYLLITTFECLKDQIWRREVIEALRSVPFHDLWLRVGDLGRGKEAQVAEVLTILAEFRELGRPLVLDAVGGLFGLTALACGGANAIAHGPGSGESCHLGNLLKKEPGGGVMSGPPRNLYVPGLFSYLNKEEWLEFYSHEAMRFHFSCVKAGCCSEENAVLDDKIGHFLRQRTTEIDGIVEHADGSGRYWTGSHLERIGDRASMIERIPFEETGIQKIATDLRSTVETLKATLRENPAGALLPAPPYCAPPERTSILSLCSPPPPSRRPRSSPIDRPRPVQPAPYRDPNTPDMF
jgi:hypothetical protein